MTVKDAFEVVAAGPAWRSCRCRSPGCTTARTRPTARSRTCRPPRSAWPGWSTTRTRASSVHRHRPGAHGAQLPRLTGSVRPRSRLPRQLRGDLRFHSCPEQRPRIASGRLTRRSPPHLIERRRRRSTGADTRDDTAGSRTRPGPTGDAHPRRRPPTDPHPALDVPVEEAGPQRPASTRSSSASPPRSPSAFLVWGFVSTDSLASVSGNALAWTMANTGWLFVLTSSGFVVFVLWLALSRFGNIPLGRDDEEPEFKTVSWVAMMFSAGMGIGLMFYGVSEPITHFATPPPGTGAAGNPEAVQNAMATTLFHWTLHPWAIYAVVGLAIAYGVYRKGRLQLIRAAFEPLLGKRANGPGGKVIDMLAIFATLFGSAASLGLGALQIRSGLQIVERHRRDRQRRPGRHHRGPDRRVRALGGLRCRQGHPVAVEHQHGAGHRARAVRVRGRPDRLHPQPGPDLDRHLLPGPRDDVGAHRRRGRRRPTTGCRAGRSSTGPGGSPGRRSSACSSPASPAAAPSASSSPACCWCRAWSAWSGSASSAARRSTLQQTGIDIAGAATRRRSCSACSRPTRWRPSPASW